MTTKSNFQRTRIILCYLVLTLGVLWLAACSSTDEPAAPATEAPTVAAPTNTSAPVPTEPPAASDVAVVLPTEVPATEAPAVEVGAASPPTSTITGVEVFTGLTANHLQTQITYTLSPPPGGDHNPAWMNCGVYTETLFNELAVHSLEHGAVWITYQPDLAADQLEVLKKLTKAGAYRLLSPYPDLSHPVVVSAWGFQLRLESATDPRLEQFVADYENRPDGPEFGAPCSGAYGNPEK